MKASNYGTTSTMIMNKDNMKVDIHRGIKQFGEFILMK